jgi:hypothetical protein
VPASDTAFVYDDALSLRAARERYFGLAGIEPGYDAAWVKLKAGPIPLWFPNTKARIRAVKLHDLHHVVTGYTTTWTGEAEIGAWEISSGCAGFVAAWLLNLSAFAIGLVIAPAATWRAFVRGRQTRNLYGSEGELREALLDESVGALRRRLGLDRPLQPAGPSDRLTFGVWSLLAAAQMLWLPAVVAWLAL